jgi:hypothetical protein
MLRDKKTARRTGSGLRARHTRKQAGLAGQQFGRPGRLFDVRAKGAQVGLGLFLKDRAAQKPTRRIEMSNQRTQQIDTLWVGVGLGAVGGYLLTQQLWVLWQLMTQDVGRSLRLHRNEAPKGQSFSEITETEAYTRRHTIQDGITIHPSGILHGELAHRCYGLPVRTILYSWNPQNAVRQRIIKQIT